jgi:hypothetical protein
MRTIKTLGTVCFTCVATLCGAGQSQTTQASTTTNRAKALYLVVTVDWEGRDLASANIEAMRKLRQDYPEVPFVHYLNAAYFTKSNADSFEVKRKIDSVLLPIDEQGLHIHGWKSLFEAAGVTHRRSPNWIPNGQSLTDAECAYDCGHTIPITAYTYSELRQVINYSIRVLTDHGYNRPKSFRAGGWLASDNLFQALAAEGFTSDSSAVNPAFLKAKLQTYNLYTWLVNTWPSITTTSQPYVTPQNVWEFPDNGCLADYVTYQDMVGVINANLKQLQASTESTNRYVVIGFHQETAAQYGSRIRQILSAVRSYNKTATLPIKYTTLNINQP